MGGWVTNGTRPFIIWIMSGIYLHIKRTKRTVIDIRGRVWGTYNPKKQIY